MSYNAVVLSVMIATPGDVAAERRIIRDEIDEWNVTHARHRQLVLMAEGWDTHATPEMGDRPQGIINKQLLSHADLLVGVFWTRLGTPTGEAASGTVEEIEKHLAEGKPAMIYFSATPVSPDSVDPAQYKAVKDFRESLQPRGLYFGYESHDQFRDLFRKHLAKTVNESFKGAVAGETGATPTTRTVRIRPESRQILLEASAGPSNEILAPVSLGGLIVQVNDKQLNEFGNRRDEARWRAALEELENLGLIVSPGGDRGYFELTDAGYEAADQLRARGDDAGEATGANAGDSK